MAELIKFEVVDLPQIYLVGKETKYNIEAHIKVITVSLPFGTNVLPMELFPYLKSRRSMFTNQRM